MKNADFGHIKRIIANDDRLAHIGRQGRIEGSKTLESHAIPVDFATFVHREEEQIELFQALGKPGEKAAAFPSCLRYFTRFTMGRLMILVQDKALQLSYKGR